MGTKGYSFPRREGVKAQCSGSLDQIQGPTYKVLEPTFQEGVSPAPLPQAYLPRSHLTFPAPITFSAA